MLNPKVNGTKISYYFICHRKLWLFDRQLQFESDFSTVEEGKFISETTYPNERHEIQLSEGAVLDFYDQHHKVVHEVKKSDKMEEAHLWQLKYYLYYLKSFGVEEVTGRLDYPKLKKTLDVVLSVDDEQKIQEIFDEMTALVNQEKAPERINKKFCKKCAYYEFCWV